jgi:protein-tyrosine phosphatase
MGLRSVVSLLEIDESRELGLANEESLYRAAGLRFLSFPIPDRGVPRDHAAFTELVDTLADGLRSGDSVAIHWRAGIGRSGLVGACVLGVFDVPPDSALEMQSRALITMTCVTGRTLALAHSTAEIALWSPGTRPS